MKRIHNILLYSIAFVIPVFVYGTVRSLSEIEIKIYPIITAPFIVDIFNTSKLWMFSFLIGCIMLLFVMRVLKHDVKLKFYSIYTPIYTFMIMVYLSTVISEYPNIAAHGFADHYMGSDVFIMGGLLVILMPFLCESWETIKGILIGFGVANVPIFVLGFLQGNDIFPLRDVNNMGWLFVGIDRFDEAYVKLFLNSISGFEPGFNKVSSTLFHANFLGVYAVTSFIAMAILYINEDSRKFKVLYFILLIFSGLNLLMSGSKASIIIAGIILIGYLILNLIKKLLGIKIKWISFLAFVVTIGVMVIGFNELSDGYFEKMISKTEEGIDYAICSEEDTAYFNVTDFYFEGNTAIIKNARSEFVIGIDDEGKVYNINAIEIESYKEWQVFYEEELLGVKLKDGGIAYFGVMSDGMLGVASSNGLTREVDAQKELKIKGDLFTNRGYIWSKAIDLIIEKPLIGYGSDTYAIYENDNDFINKMNHGHGTTSMALYPHNLYIMIAFNSGIISLVAFLSFILWVCIKGMIKYWRYAKKRDGVELYKIELVFIPLLTFLLVSITNDLIIGTVAMFFLLLGIAGVYTTGILENDDILEMSGGEKND